MITRILSVAFCAAILTTSGCGLDPTSLVRSLLPLPLQAAGSEFVDQGIFQLKPVGLFSSTTCPVWVDDTGVVYHLFQDPGLSNADFDKITQPGVHSRLLLVARQDLQVGCLSGPAVQVLQVIELLP